ncbi:hypothetical protein FQN60_005322, partial [Etheostoma spectabile]
MAAHLSYGRVNLNILREAARRELREFLDKCAGSKAIVWDEYLTGPFGLIAQYSLLKDKMHSPRDFHVLFVPRRSLLCEQRLKEQGVLASFINIDEYILDLIPYDGDLLSMEYESAFRHVANMMLRMKREFAGSYVKLPPEKFAQKKPGEASKDLPTEPKKLQLNSAEELYAEIRDKNFNAVGAALSKKAKIISAAFE